MAATVSSVWAKPGAWALDSEEHEDELNQPIMVQTPKPEPPAADFPSLAAASVAKPKKKNKAQTLSLAEFSTYGAPKPFAAPKRLTQDELSMLPTGPRERTAEELDGSRLGGGFRNYGGGMGDNSRVRVSDRNSNRERDMGPSRADEADDWSKEKKIGSFGGGASDRSERRDRGGFFNSSRADEVDNWSSSKSFVAAPLDGPRRERRMGFESYANGSGPDSDTWGRKKEERGGGFEADTWGKRESNGAGRPRLNLQPRTLPVASNNDGVQTTPTESKPKGPSPFGDARPRDEEVKPIVTKPLGELRPKDDEPKPKGANPFGEARPREEVLAEKGKDWKEIDEKLEAVKVKEVGNGEKGEGLGWRKGFGSSDSGEKTVKSWRKPESTPASSAETTETSANTSENNAESAEKVSEEN